MSDPKDTTGTSLMLFLLGAAVGALVVALTTPKTGPELRSDLKDLGAKLKEKARRMSDRVRADGEEVIQGG